MGRRPVRRRALERINEKRPASGIAGRRFVLVGEGGGQPFSGFNAQAPMPAALARAQDMASMAAWDLGCGASMM